MSRSIARLFNQYHIDRLRDNDISIESSHFRKRITLKGNPIFINKNIHRPKRKNIERYIENTIMYFSDYEKEIHDIIQSSALDEDYVLDIIKTGIKIGTSISLIKEKIKEEEMSIGIHEEIKSLIETNDYPDVFPSARNVKRKIIACLGDTNAGKTYHALEILKESSSGVYAAPLRLLALENYNYLNESGLPTSLITGEEKIFVEMAEHTSCTVECLSTEIPYETVVIDEIQMMDDDQRGSFFVQALVGANADYVVVTGPKEYKKRLQKIADYLDEEIEFRFYERKTQLLPKKKPTKIKDVRPNTAIIAFSKRELYNIQRKLPKHIKSTLLYGSLGCEVRKEQAERFANGEVDVVITTDCIGMGLNLPIEHVLFTKVSKYDGESVKSISTMLTKQIAGRAGRYGKFNKGYFSGVNKETHEFVKSNVGSKLKPDNDKPLEVLPPERYVKLLSTKYTLSGILETWAEKMCFDEGSLFVTTCLENQILIAKWLESNYPNDYKDYWRLIYCPIDFPKQEIEFCKASERIIRNEPVPIPFINTQIMGQNDLELMLREINMLKWFLNQYPENFDDNAPDEIENCVYLITVELNKRLS